jgi:hypothetical protein
MQEIYSVLETPSIAQPNRLEFELLLSCLRSRLNPAWANVTRELTHQPLHWPTFLTLAAQHSVLPLIHQSLNALCPQQIPISIQASLQAEVRKLTLHNMRLSQELTQLANLLATHEIRVICFKGPCLAVTAYEDLKLRQFSDLDILVDPTDFLQVRRLMAQLGYASSQRSWHFLSEQQEESYFYATGECALYNTRTALDLHHQLVPRYFLSAQPSFDALWQRAETLTLWGTQLSSLHPDDLLLYLCWHGSKDCWASLKSVCDLAELLHRRAGHIDWPAVVAQAEASGSIRMLCTGLSLAHNLLGVELPEPVLGLLDANPIGQKLAEAAIARQLNPNSSGSHILHRIWFYLKLKSRWADKVGYVNQLISSTITPNSKDQTFLPLPTQLHFLYYLLRPVRVITKQVQFSLIKD